MTPKRRPQSTQARCPRCDEQLTVSLFGRGSARGLTLACPELYCDYSWAPTQGELARMGPLDPPEAPVDPDGIQRAAG